jgi:hypothetical protein
MLGPEFKQAPIENAGNWTGRDIYNSFKGFFTGQDPDATTMLLKSGKSVKKQLHGMNRQMRYIVSREIEEREFPEAIAAIHEHLGPGGKFDIIVRLGATMKRWKSAKAQELGYQQATEVKIDLGQKIKDLGFENLGPVQGPNPGWLFFLNNDDSIYVHFIGYKSGRADDGNGPALNATD